MAITDRLCPHCDRPESALLIDDTGHWACHCGGHGHVDQLVTPGEEYDDGGLNWTTVGEELRDRARAKAEGHNWTTRDEIAAAIDDLEWVDLTGEPLRLPAMAGLGIEGIRDALDLRKVTAVAVGVVRCWSDNEPGESTYGLYGIRNHYADGDALIYAVDRGSDCLVVASLPPDRVRWNNPTIERSHADAECD